MNIIRIDLGVSGVFHSVGQFSLEIHSKVLRAQQSLLKSLALCLKFIIGSHIYALITEFKRVLRCMNITLYNTKK